MALLVKDLSAGYGRQDVLFGVNMNLEKGNICALIGPNGSGKTTLMRCINGILKPSKGHIMVNDLDLTKMKRSEIARHISIVPQTGTNGVFPYSCMQMILMGGASRLKIWGAPGKDEEKKAHEVCSRIGIEDLFEKSFKQLSGGQKQLVMLARALHQGGRIMLLDEPNSHLDFCNQHKMMKIIREVVKDNNAAALITLHDPNLALFYCDQVVMLRQGMVEARGPAEKIINDISLQKVLGDNICLDTTLKGNRVVLPLSVMNDKEN